MCGATLRNHYAPLYTLAEPRVCHGYRVTQDFHRPYCAACARRVPANEGLAYEEWVVQMDIIPPRVAVDAYEPFGEFSTSVEDGRGGYRTEHIDSLAKLRKVERESEQRYRNGEGRPMAWRDYSQDRSNRDVHSLMADPSEAPTKSAKLKVRAVGGEPTGDLGPGVTESTPSPLDAL
jgi:hypothetical protein